MVSRRFMVGLYVTALVALADQLSKWFVLRHMGDVEKTQAVTSWFNLVLVWNKGVTFGLLNHTGHAAMLWILIGVAVAILLLLGRWLYRTESLLVAVALGGIMGGAVGNVADRLRHGAVVDFLDFHYQSWHWYAFNVGDAAIVAGVALLLLDGVVRGK